MNEINCPNCGAPFIFAETRWKQVAKCSNCNLPLTLDAHGIDPADENTIVNTDSPTIAPELPPSASVDGSTNISKLSNFSITEHPDDAPTIVDNLQLPPSAESLAPTVVSNTAPTIQTDEFAPTIQAEGINPPGANSPTEFDETLDGSQTYPAQPNIVTEPTAILKPTATELAYQRKSFNPATLIIGLIILMAIPMGLLGAYVLVGDDLFGSADVEKKVAKQGRGKDANADRAKWPTAYKNALKLGKFQIQVKEVDFAPVRGRDASNVVQTSGETAYVHVRLEIRNTGADGHEYLSWYGNIFENGKYRAELFDQDNSELEMMVFEDVKGIAGHTSGATLDRKEIIEDVIIFELNESQEIADIDTLYCRLPGQALGISGEIKFKIPKSMIKDSSNISTEFGQ